MNFEQIKVKDIFGVVQYKPTIKRWTAKNRVHHIVGLQLSGKAMHDLGYKQFTLNDTCAYFFNQKDDYRVEVLETPSEAFSFHFTTYEDIDTDSFCLPLTSCDAFLSILQKAKVEKNSNLARTSLLYRFLAELSQLRQKKYAPKDARMTAAKLYIDAHFCEKGCLNTAISKSGITARRFCDLFRENFNMTPNRYVTFRRIDRAKELLITGSLTVTGVAELCGYSDIYYFSKVFKKEVGVSPNNWA